MVRADLDRFASAKILIQANQNAKLRINSISGAKKIIVDLKWHFGIGKHWRLQYNCLSTNYWCYTETAADKASVPRLVGALVVFIK